MDIFGDVEREKKNTMEYNCGLCKCANVCSTCVLKLCIKIEIFSSYKAVSINEIWNSLIKYWTIFFSLFFISNHTHIHACTYIQMLIQTVLATRVSFRYENRKIQINNHKSINCIHLLLVSFVCVTYDWCV